MADKEGCLLLLPADFRTLKKPLCSRNWALLRETNRVNRDWCKALMFGEQRMWFQPHAAPLSTLISIMTGGRESIIGPSNQRAQRMVSLDEEKWTSNYASWHKALGTAETHCPSHYKVKSLPDQFGKHPKASSFICQLIIKVSLIEQQAINPPPLKITVHNFNLCSAAECETHALPIAEAFTYTQLVTWVRDFSAH